MRNYYFSREYLKEVNDMIMLKILVLISIIFLVTYLTQFGYAEQFEKKRLVITLKTWSMVGNGQVCIFNYDGENDCSYFKTTFKHKMYKKVYLDAPENFVKNG